MNFEAKAGVVIVTIPHTDDEHKVTKLLLTTQEARDFAVNFAKTTAQAEMLAAVEQRQDGIDAANRPAPPSAADCRDCKHVRADSDGLYCTHDSAFAVRPSGVKIEVHRRLLSAPNHCGQAAAFFERADDAELRRRFRPV